MLIRLLAMLPLLLTLMVSSVSYAAQPQRDVSCFLDVPAITDCIDPRFLPYWQGNGGLPVFGYPISPVLPEETEGELRTVQHFERNRLELHPEAPAPYTTQLGRLGAERLTQLGREPEPPVAPRVNCYFFVETGHNVCGPMWSYWQSHGLELGDRGTSFRESLALLGLPLTEARVETNEAGDRVLTQWFERVRLEDHDGLVLQGLLNVELQAALTPAAPAPGFVEIVGDQLMQQGQPIFLKGTNYYPAAQPWRHMWIEWDGPVIERELAKARRELGINTVRVLIPYRTYEGWTDGYGSVKPQMLERLREFVQIAGSHHVKVLITLFDWYDTASAAGSQTEQYELRYLTTIVSALKDDDRVLAWDIHNEPDHYSMWQNGGAPAVVDWLGRMADAIHAIDPHHPVTVGVGQAGSLWQAAPNGRTIAEISDIISVHSYDAMAYEAIIADVRSRSAKPILLEEFGWASGPECRGTYFDETSQLFLYRHAMRAAASEGLAGMLNWWLQDPPITSAYAVDENAYYGLFRRDGSPKPAAGPFRSLRVPALPSTTMSSSPLTVASVPPRPPEHQPVFFGDDLVLKDEFKYFWMYFGGEQIFGRPLTNAYRDEQGTLVQYFEKARLELNDDTRITLDPLAPALQRPEVYLDRVHLTPLGEQALAGRASAPVSDPQQPDVLYFAETGHTLRGDFRALWETHGAAFFGLPLSEPIDEQIEGERVTVQYFTNWRFEQRAGGDVQLTALGVDALAARECPKPF